jgi:hypothetical protein
MTLTKEVFTSEIRVSSSFINIGLVKDKQYLDFEELLKDVKPNHRRSQTICDSVRQGIVPNSYRNLGIDEESNSNPRRRDLLNLRKLNKSTLANKHIHIFKKKLEQNTKRCQSVLAKRRDWNTSSAKCATEEDTQLDLSKKEFGPEYRRVLDKLLEPKLPDNRALKADPAYEYAQKAHKLRIVKKVDLLKNKDYLKYLQRKTKSSFIRNML